MDRKPLLPRILVRPPLSYRKACVLTVRTTDYRVPPVEQRPSYLTDLTGFLKGHRPHGTLNEKATEPEWNGYRLIVACSCGVTF